MRHKKVSCRIAKRKAQIAVGRSQVTLLILAAFGFPSSEALHLRPRHVNMKGQIEISLIAKRH